MDIEDFQKIIARTYLQKDSSRGKWGTYAWLVEEVGELSRALRKGDRDSLHQEFGDVFAWLASLANLCDVDLGEAAGRYEGGCPKCHAIPCTCPEEEAGA